MKNILHKVTVVTHHVGGLVMGRGGRVSEGLLGFEGERRGGGSVVANRVRHVYCLLQLPTRAFRLIFFGRLVGDHKNNIKP